MCTYVCCRLARDVPREFAPVEAAYQVQAGQLFVVQSLVSGSSLSFEWLWKQDFGAGLTSRVTLPTPFRDVAEGDSLLLQPGPTVFSCPSVGKHVTLHEQQEPVADKAVFFPSSLIAVTAVYFTCLVTVNKISGKLSG